MAIITFSELYTQYYKSSFLFVKSYIRDDMASEDIVSESLISLWQTIKKETVEHPRGLLLKILKHNALNYLKHQDVRQAVMESIINKMSFWSIPLFNNHLTNRESRIGNDLETSEVLWSA